MLGYLLHGGLGLKPKDEQAHKCKVRGGGTLTVPGKTNHTHTHTSNSTAPLLSQKTALFVADRSWRRWFGCSIPA